MPSDLEQVRELKAIKDSARRIIRKLGGAKSLPSGTRKLILAELRLAVIGGAAREREHTQRVLGMPRFDRREFVDTLGIWMKIISVPIVKTTGLESEGPTNAD